MVYVHLAHGYEEIEALTVVDILRRGKVQVQTVAMDDQLLIEGAHGIKVECDLTFDQADYDQCEMIVLPGGIPGAPNLEAHQGLMTQLEDFAAKGKGIAAICASPGMVLAPHGILDGKMATVYPGFEDELEMGGACHVDVPAIVAGNVITGKGPGYAADFALAILEELAGEDIAKQVATGYLHKR